jgi:hypothetical protein
MSDATKAAPSVERTRAEEVREIVLLLAMLVDRMDRACVKFGCTRSQLLGGK